MGSLTDKQPRGLYMLFLVEMWERFSYYGMRSLLALFMISPIIGFSKKGASDIYAFFTGFVYLTPLIGGYLADRYLGKRKAIIIGAILMALGQFGLASYDMWDPKMALALGLILLIIGNGFFKSSMTSLVGDLYEPGDKRRDGGFTIFYMGVNLGALLSPLICGYLGQKIAWKYGFLAAAIGMVIGTIWFALAQNKYLGNIGLKPAGIKNKNDNTPKEPLTKVEKDRIYTIFIFTFFSILFWTFFEQAGTSLTFFAEEATRRTFFGITIESSQFQVLNPLFILILAPMFSRMWTKMGDKEITTPIKFMWALLALGVGFLIITLGAWFYEHGGAVSAMWLAGLYFMQTCGELCISPVGNAMVTKLAPAKFGALLMGVWMSGIFIGNILAGKFGGLYDSVDNLAVLFAVPAICSLAFAVIIWKSRRKVEGLMHGVR